ncbi:MAG: iron ABC transporter permease [Thermoprotei archaeon]|nr:MAG: iron ABC transporter permease [Thermoprotei archaeon]
MSKMSIRAGITKLARKYNLDSFILVQLVLVVSILVIFLILPISTLLVKAFVHEGHFSIKYFRELFSDPEAIIFPPRGLMIRVETTYRYEILPNGTRILIPEKVIYIGKMGPDFGYLLNSLFVALMVALFSLILGVPTAFIMAKYDFPGKSLFSILLLVPMLATPFVNAFIIGKILGRSGVLNYILFEKLHILPYRIEIAGLPAVILIQTLTFFPIVYLNVYAAIMNIDPSLEEQAENLGAKGFKLFRTITWPLSLPGIAAGLVLVFIFSLEDLGAPIGLSGAFGHGLHQKVISFIIYDEFRKAVGGIAQIYPTTYALAVFLLFIATTGFLSIKKYISLRTYAMMVKGTLLNRRIKRISTIRALAIYVFLIPLVFISSFPQIGTVILALTDWALRIRPPLPSRFTWEYISSLIRDPSVFRAILNSLTYSSIAVIFIILIGTSASYLVARSRIPGRDIIDALVTIPIATPGIIIAVGYLLFFATYFAGTPLSPFNNPGLLLIFTYTIRRLPFTARTVFAGLQQIHVTLEEVSYSLGAGRATTFFRIVLPLIQGNIVGGALLSFVYSMGEVSTSITLSALNPTQGPITFKMSQAIYATAAVGSVCIAAALGVLLMILQIIAISISNYVLKQRVALIGV